ncbi:MAG TPA: hypothetical protein VFO38_00225 [Candidatus Saccharimonadales bacterium]|nr:hypothetical protein [Candidatus Saccharimonadales bacterium]
MSVRDSALVVFGITVIAYAINLVYELTRLSSYGISHDLVQVKLQNFLITGFTIGLVVGTAAYTQSMLFKSIEKRVKGEIGAVHIKERVLQVMVLAMFAFTFLFCSALSKFIHHEPIFIQGFKILALASAIGAGYAMLVTGWLYGKAKLRRQPFSSLIKEKYEQVGSKHIPGRQPKLTAVYIAAISLSLVAIPTSGFSAASTTRDVYVIKMNGEESKKVIIGVYNDYYIVKDYDVVAKRYLEGYSLVEIKDKEVQYIKNIF